MISWIRKHPWLATILSFVVVTAPQWIASVWALFSSEPLLPWLVRHNFPRLVFSPWWISGSIGAILFIVILSVLRRRGVDALAQTSDIVFELTRDRWASPVLATVINKNRDYPAHLKTSTLFGIKRDGSTVKLQTSWNRKFEDCVTLPYSLPPDRQARLAYPGHFPFDETLQGLFAELELENGTKIVSPRIPPPNPPISGRPREDLDERDKMMLACADTMTRGKKMFWALLEAKADELTDNDDLVYICEKLSNEGHENQLEVIPKSSWLFVLKKARLSPNRPRNEVELYDFICQLAGLRGSAPRSSTTASNSTRAYAQLVIEALPPTPNTKNLTQLAWNKKGRPPFDAYCILSVHNPNLAQGVDGVVFRLLSIKPELTSSRGFDPATNDIDLRKLQFSFADIPGNTLKGDQTGYITVFRATRLPMGDEALKNITVQFEGSWQASVRNSFIPQARHIMTVEVTASGLERTESHFEISFSTKLEEPVFSLTKVSD